MPIVLRNIFFVLSLIIATPAFSALETTAQQAIIIDDQTGATLFNKEGDARMFPASMTKMMTAHILFRELKEGKISLDTKFHVNETAWKIQGSKMFVELGNDIPVEDLLRGIVIQSGNDACVVVAEALAGSEASFADMMNDEAKRIGMTGSNFRNSTGWPDENHYSTARDLALLAQDTIHNYPEFYKYYAEPEYVYHGIRQYNRNLLLNKGMGVDGLKTGHTEVSGYGITVSAIRENRRVIVVVNGLTSEKERADEAMKLVQFAYGAFENIPLVTAGQVIESIPVVKGATDSVTLTVANDAIISLPKIGREQVKVDISYDTPVVGPVTKGSVLGRMIITAPEVTPQEVQLVAGEDIAPAGFFKRAMDNLKLMISK